MSDTPKEITPESLYAEHKTLAGNKAAKNARVIQELEEEEAGVVDVLGLAVADVREARRDYNANIKKAAQHVINNEFDYKALAEAENDKLFPKEK